MQILENGHVYLETGEKMPYRCPECKTHIAFRKVAELTCDTCGHHGTAEEFSRVEYTLQKPN